jgi:hypothetical protein
LALVGFISVPLGANSEGVQGGFGLSFGAGWGLIPLTLGIDLMSAWGGTESPPATVSSSQPPAKVESQDTTYYFDAWARLQPPFYWLRPYLEGFAGTKLLQSSYSLYFAASDSSTDKTTSSRWASSLGWGVGVDVGWPGAENTIKLTVGFRRLYGGDASFTRTATVNGASEVVTVNVPTSVTLWMIGATGSFGSPDRPDAHSH